MEPHVPPLLTPDLPPTGGRIGPDPEDFEVTEVPLYEPSGDGEHLYVFVQKRSLTTPALVQILARAANVQERDIGYAGLKDKHAVTRQWLSLPRTARPTSEWDLPEQVTLLSSSRHSNKLRTGHLRANRFKIRLIGCAEDAPARALAITRHIEAHGLPNYFGAQRFGIQGRNVEQALGWLARLLRSQGKQRSKHFEQKLFPSVLQSEVFNRYLTLRCGRGLSKLIAGEVVRLAGTGSHFVVQERHKEQPRFDAKDLELTGPMFGPKLRAASDDALELEQTAQGALGLGADALELLGSYAPGTRRDLLVRPEGLELMARAPGELEVAFTLPSGSYATEVVRALTHAPFLEATNSELGV